MVSALHGGQPSGIVGLRPRDPVLVAATIGRKSERGFPEENDRWHIVDAVGVDGKKNQAPGFAAFNSAPAGRRKILRGTLAHASPDDAFHHSLKAHLLPGLAHPQQRPSCVGDGKTAVRWGGKEPNEFDTIPCPHDRCQYRQPQGRKPAPCKPFAQLIFQLRWAPESPLPCVLAKFSTGSWNTAANMLGFFQHLRVACGTAAHGRRISLVGFPFMMMLTEKTNRERKTRFPVVRFSPELDAADFARAQLDVVGALPQAPASIEDLTAAEVADDMAALAPGPAHKPTREGSGNG